MTGPICPLANPNSFSSIGIKPGISLTIFIAIATASAALEPYLQQIQLGLYFGRGTTIQHAVKWPCLRMFECVFVYLR